MRRFTALVVVAGVVAMAGPTYAGNVVEVPAGTPVLLKFLTPIDSATVKEGTNVKFEVATDVLVDRDVIIRQGAPATGIVTEVSQPGIFGKNARVRISYLLATAVDDRPVRLSPLDVTPESLRQAQDVGAAGASSVAGAILLGPVGLAAGALVHGGHVTAPEGAMGTAKVAETFQITLP